MSSEYGEKLTVVKSPLFLGYNLQPHFYLPFESRIDSRKMFLPSLNCNYKLLDEKTVFVNGNVAWLPPFWLHFEKILYFLLSTNLIENWTHNHMQGVPKSHSDYRVANSTICQWFLCSLVTSFLTTLWEGTVLLINPQSDGELNPQPNARCLWVPLRLLCAKIQNSTIHQWFLCLT